MRDDTPQPRSLRLVFPETEVIPFPAKFRIGKIRRMAEMMDETTKRHADALWRQAIDGMRRQMERSGIDEDRIAVELRDFAQAVENELTRRSFGLSRFDGGDAA